jgi:hypothetical protein
VVLGPGGLPGSMANWPKKVIMTSKAADFLRDPGTFCDQSAEDVLTDRADQHQLQPQEADITYEYPSRLAALQ